MREEYEPPDSWFNSYLWHKRNDPRIVEGVYREGDDLEEVLRAYCE